jgi:predicted transcriptional regulator
VNGNSTNKYIYNIEASKVFMLLYNLFSDSVEVKMLKYLSVKGSCSLRELSRFVGMHHTNVRRYVSRLVEKGILEQEYVGNTSIIKLNREYEFLRLLFDRQ